jgi:glucose uptake protein GlcU
MIDFKRREKLQMLIEVPLLILWGVWAFMTSNVEGDFAQIIGYSLIFGALLGLALAFGIFFFEMRSVNKTIRELDDYTDNK